MWLAPFYSEDSLHCKILNPNVSSESYGQDSTLKAYCSPGPLGVPCEQPCAGYSILCQPTLPAKAA